MTHPLDPGRVAELAASVGASTVQVHGEMAVADLRRPRALAPGKRLVKAVHVTGEDALGRALGFAADADALLLDSRTADRLGGTGRTHDWSVSAGVVAAVAPLPVCLAGGLRPENLAKAAERVRPARGGRETPALSTRAGARTRRRCAPLPRMSHVIQRTDPAPGVEE